MLVLHKDIHPLLTYSPSNNSQKYHNSFVGMLFSAVNFLLNIRLHNIYLYCWFIHISYFNVVFFKKYYSFVFIEV